MKKIKIILATATKIEDSDSLLVFVDPEFADMVEPITQELEFITGHSRHVVISVPASAVKIFKVKHQTLMAVDSGFAGGLLDDAGEPVDEESL